MKSFKRMATRWERSKTINSQKAKNFKAGAK